MYISKENVNKYSHGLFDTKRDFFECKSGLAKFIKRLQASQISAV